MYAPTMDKLTLAASIASRLGWAVTVHEIYSWLYRYDVSQEYALSMQPNDLLRAIQQDVSPFHYFGSHEGGDINE